MAPEVPPIQVADIIRNTLGYRMVSEKLKSLLEQHSADETEFLRFTLANHKGRVERDNCFIANVLGTHDVADPNGTEGTVDPILTGQMVRVKMITIHEDRVPPTVSLFRLATFPPAILVRDTLRAILNKEGLRGLQYLDQGQRIRL